MEDKYDYEKILLFTAMRFYNAANNEILRKIVISIEIIGSNNHCFRIGTDENNFMVLLEGVCGDKKGYVKDKNAFYESKDKLGKVHVEAEGKSIEPYDSYETFWQDIEWH